MQEEFKIENENQELKENIERQLTDFENELESLLQEGREMFL